MLIINVNVDGEFVDVAIDKGVITALGKQLNHTNEFDGQGGSLIPGLHDHHIHIQATAAAMNSVKCGPPEITTTTGLRDALRDIKGKGWIRGIGYHDSIGFVDRAWLDKHGPERPIRIQHRGGRMWILNSHAIDILGNWVPENGQLVDGDKKLRRALNGERPDLKLLVNKLLSYGITGITEVTPTNNREDYDYLVENLKPLKLSIMGTRELDGLPLAGPLKLHYHDYNLPSLEKLTDEIKGAHNAGRSVAAHCVTLAELMLTLSAIEMAGVHPDDRIEHAAIVTEDSLTWIKKLGLTVVTQPHFLKARADAYRRDVEKLDHPNLWRVGSFFNADIPFAFGSDAPFEDFNPWSVIQAAVDRPDGFGTDEKIKHKQALNAYLKPAHKAGAEPRRIKVGERADLCLLGKSGNVAATWIDGKLVFRSDNFINQPPV